MPNVTTALRVQQGGNPLGAIRVLNFKPSLVGAVSGAVCNLATAGGGGPFEETFFGPASSVTLAVTPSVLLLEKNGVEQHPVGGVPAEGEYSIAGNVVTITLAAGDILDAFE